MVEKENARRRYMKTTSLLTKTQDPTSFILFFTIDGWFPIWVLTEALSGMTYLTLYGDVFILKGSEYLISIIDSYIMNIFEFIDCFGFLLDEKNY